MVPATSNSMWPPMRYAAPVLGCVAFCACAQCNLPRICCMQASECCCTLTAPTDPCSHAPRHVWRHVCACVSITPFQGMAPSNVDLSAETGGQAAVLNCQPGSVIDVVKATYNTDCPAVPDADNETVQTDLLGSACNGKTDCTYTTQASPSAQWNEPFELRGPLTHLSRVLVPFMSCRLIAFALMPPPLVQVAANMNTSGSASAMHLKPQPCRRSPSQFPRIIWKRLSACVMP